MNWVRTRARRLSLLALFALATQLGLSFGHTHAHAWLPSGTQTVATSSHTQDHRTPDIDDLCPICLSVAMVWSATDATPPALPVPATFSAVSFAAEKFSERQLARLAAFRSRAPPLS